MSFTFQARIRTLMSRIFFCMLLLTVNVVSAKTLTVDDYSKLEDTKFMRISPSGQFVAFVKSNEKSKDGEMLVVYSLKESKAVAGAYLGELSAYDINFISDEQVILKAGKVRRIFGFRGDINMGTAYRLDIKTGDIGQLLVPGKGIFLGQSGLGDIVGLSPDHKWAYMPAYTGDDFARDENPEFSLMKVSLTKIRRPKVHELGANHTYQYFVDEKGEVLAELRFHQKYDRHEVFSHLSGKEEKIFEEKTAMRSFSATGVTPDRKHLVIMVSSKSYDRDIVRLMSLADGSVSDPIFARDDADVDGFITDIQGVVHGVRYSGLNPSYEFFDGSIAGRITEFNKNFDGASVWLADWTENFEKMIVFVEGSNSAGEFFLVEKDGKPRFLASSRGHISAQDVHPVGHVTFTARDGLKIPTILTIPQQHVQTMKNLPAIMMPHGGPEASDVIGFDWMAQALAAQGYLIIQPQFRGSSGLGVAHVLAGRGEWGKKMQDDLTDAVEFLAKKEIIDPERVCIVGGSYGGYAALAGAAFTPDVYKCAVSINGVSDLWAMLKEEKYDNGSESDIVEYWNRQFSGGNEYSKESLKAISPINYVEKVKAPVLLLHGEKDRVVRVRHSKRMYKALKGAGQKVKFVELDGEDHHLSQADTRRQALKEIVKFLNKNLKEKVGSDVAEVTAN